MSRPSVASASSAHIPTRKSTRERRRLAVGAVAAALGLAVALPLTASAAPDAGITSLPPDQVAPMVVQAGESARSFHLFETDDPNTVASYYVGVNVASDFFRFGRYHNATLAVRRIGDEIWYQPNAAFWLNTLHSDRQQAEKFIAAQDGKWVHAYAGSSLYRFNRPLTFPKELMQGILSFPANLVRISGRVVDGRPTYGITGSAHGDRVYAATHQEPYPLLILSHAEQQPAYRQRLSSWNVPLIVDRPADSASIPFPRFLREASPKGSGDAMVRGAVSAVRLGR